MKLKNIEIGQLVYVLTQEEALAIKGATSNTSNSNARVVAPNGDEYLWYAEGHCAGGVYRVNSIGEDGRTRNIGLDGLDEYYVSPKFLRKAKPSDVSIAIEKYKRTLLDEVFHQLGFLEVSDELEILSGQTKQDLLSEALLSYIANALKTEEDYE